MSTAVLAPNSLKAPVIGLDDDFPIILFVLKHEPSGKWGCYSHEDIHGLACFSDKSGAQEFGSYIELPGMKILEASFDKARDIAKKRPSPICCLILLDNMDDPKIHYVC